MLAIIGIGISQVTASAFATEIVDHGGYEMRIHFDRALSLTSSRVGDRFIATVADPGPFNLARISGHIQSITPSGLLSGGTEINLSFDRIRFNDGEAYPINAEIVRLYDVASGEQVDAQDLIDTSGRRRPQTLKRTGIGAVTGGIFGLTPRTGVDSRAIRPRVAAIATTPAFGRKDLLLDEGVEMLLRVYPDQNLR
ncbi:MAG TPA: hypothetical protein VFS76_25485 [Pyrinomonadaceae bacterium]|nr:hypothetical protein [Pyrinomonadaceae bacterium]